MKLQRIRGTADLYGDDFKLFELVLETAKKFARTYCFEGMLTPIMESSEVFNRTLGEVSDIVNKETYSFLDREKRSITLRPEFTAAVIRAVIENGMLQSLPLRLFSYGPLFRHERPQKCRLRQFHQVNYEYIGSSDLNVEVELITLAFHILSKLGIMGNTKLIVNTVGTAECRNKYKAALVEYLSQYKDDLSEVSKERLEKNPLRILDTKDEVERAILKEAPILWYFVDYTSQNRFENILQKLGELEIPYEQAHMLVRGLDYYSGFVFEFVTSDLGSQGTVLAGGRYDGLVSQMGGQANPAAGFAAGIERVIELMKHNRKEMPKEDEYLIYLIPTDDKAEHDTLRFLHKIRSQELDMRLLFDFGLSFKKRMKKANKLGVETVLLYSYDDMKREEFTIKTMDNGKEVKGSINNLLESVKAYVKENHTRKMKIIEKKLEKVQYRQ
jgi:histidyl-tRNA synthetase